MKIRSKTIFSFLFLSILPLVFLGWMAYENAGRALKKNLGSHLYRIAHNTAYTIDQKFYYLFKDIMGWADLELMQEILTDDLDGRISGFFTELSKKEWDFAGFMVLNEAGEIVASDHPEGVGKSPRTQTALQAALQGRSYMSGIVFCRRHHQYEIDFAVPVRAVFDRDKVIGVLRMIWKAGSLLRMTRMEEMGDLEKENQENIYIAVLQKDGLIIAGPKEWDPYLYKDNLIRDGVQSATLASRGMEGFILERNKKWGDLLAGYDYSREGGDFWGAGWGVLAFMDAKEAFASIKRLRYMIFTLGSLVIIFVIPLALVATRKITGPLIELTRGVQKVSEGNFMTRIDIHADEEVFQLAGAFNRMTENLYRTTVSRDQMDNILNSMINSLVVLTPDGKITTVNQATCDLLGYRQEDLLGRPFDCLLTEEEILKGEGADFLIERKAVHYMEKAYRTKSGAALPVLFSSSVMSGKNDDRMGVICVAQDISERKKAEIEQARLAIALRSVWESITITDVKGVIQYVNPAFEKVTGYSASEVIGKTAGILKSGMQDEAFYKALWEAILSGKIWTATVVNRKKDGSLFTAEQIIAPVMDASEKITNFVGVLHDLTKRKEMEDDLRRVNENLTKEQRAVRALFEDLQRAHRELADREKALRGMFADIQQAHEDLKQAQRQLLQSEKLASIGQLAAGVAHEINNPVGFISSNLQTLQGYMRHVSKVLETVDQFKAAVPGRDWEKAGAAVQTIERMEKDVSLNFIVQDTDALLRESREGIDRIKKIVLDLRSFAREDEEVFEAVNVEEIIDNILSIVWNEIKYKAELKKDYSHIPPVKCNSRKIGQVFVNLLINASHAIEGKGVIEIKTYRDGGNACVEVSDTGKGMDEDTMKRIFDPFFTTKPVGEGTGLGLSISYDIVKEHGGDIVVKSKPGQGARFTVLLPLESKG
jgi:PAS domain S-box-containing protein